MTKHFNIITQIKNSDQDYKWKARLRTHNESVKTVKNDHHEMTEYSIIDK